MKIPTQDLCERLSHVEGMRHIGPLIAEARATIDAQAARIAELEAQLNAPRGTDEQIQKERTLTCEAIRGAMAFGYNGTNPPPRDNHWLAQFWEFGHKHAALEAQLRERGEPVAWRFKTRSGNERWRYEEFEPTHISDYVFEKYPLYYHPPAAAATFTCAARRQGSAGGNDPADCDWPTCGCDEHASKVIATLQESGHLKEPAAAASEDKRDAERYRYLRNIKRQECLEMDGPEAGVWIDSEDENGTLQLLTEADADAAIDAAIAAQKERGE
jgi:hypothetical protein